MTRKQTADGEGVSRRTFVALTGAAGVAGLAGCSGQGGSEEAEADSGGSTETATATATESGSDAMGTSLLTAEGSSTVYPISNTGSSY